MVYMVLYGLVIEVCYSYCTIQIAINEKTIIDTLNIRCSNVYYCIIPKSYYQVPSGLIFDCKTFECMGMMLSV